MVKPSNEEIKAIHYLRSLPAIRERCDAIFELALSDGLTHFRYHPERMEDAVDFVIKTSRDAYPSLDIPPASRWPHFQTGGAPRLEMLEAEWNDCDLIEKCRRRIDLVVVSILLDAGAGPRWCYQDEKGHRITLSLGIAVACWQMFRDGYFSSQPEVPWRVDSEGLFRLSEEILATGFQITPGNSMPGFAGRWQLLKRLGHVLLLHPEYFGKQDPRPGNLLDFLFTVQKDHAVSITSLWEVIMEGLGEVWPDERTTIAGVNLGDVWLHSSLPSTSCGSNLIPFHKLSQWMAYSLLEPIQAAGLIVNATDLLSGLAEYRNGGLFIDMGVLESKYSELTRKIYPPDAEPIVEWRALTVSLLDQLTDQIRQALGMSPAQLSLSQVMQGGTWESGRTLADTLRKDMEPPIRVEIDGTIF